MENYIVRIYRRNSNDPDSITGVVEKPDRHESEPFSSIDNLISILVPRGYNTGESKQKQVVEKRKYRRFAVNEGTLIFNDSTDVGEIVDISMGGLSFTCPDDPEESSSLTDISILFGENEYSTGKIKCKKVMCHGTAGFSAFSDQEKTKRYSIEFGDLNPDQRLQLNHIIQSYSLNGA